MTHVSDKKTNKEEFRFLGPERYYHVAGRQLDERTNDGSEYYLEEKSRHARTVLASVIAVSIVVTVLTGMICLASGPLTPLKRNSMCSSEVKDSADIIVDDKVLQTQLDEYMRCTGICSVVLTAYDEDWNENYRDLSDYAISCNSSAFSEQEYLIIACSISKNDVAALEQGQPFSGCDIVVLRGKNTGAIVTLPVKSKMGNTIKQDLKNGTGLDAALSDALDFAVSDADSRINPTTERRWMNLVIGFVPIPIVIIVSIIAIIVTVKKFRQDKNVGFKDAKFSEPAV